MVSVADRSSTMLSQDSIHDFVLFPTQDSSLAELLGQPQAGVDYDSQFTSNSLPESYTTVGMTYNPYPASVAYPSQPSYYEASSFLTSPPASTKQQASPALSPSQSFEQPPLTNSSSESGPSIPSAASSSIGSPYSSASNGIMAAEAWDNSNHILPMGPGIVHHDRYGPEHFMPAGLDHDLMYPADKIQSTFVDPSLIQPFPTQTAHTSIHGGEINTFTSPHVTVFQPSSPAPSAASNPSQRPGSAHLQAGAQSPYPHAAAYHPYQTYSDGRRPSTSSNHSRLSGSPRSSGVGCEDEESEKGRCPDPKCGKVFKDLKAHILTHQSERPEKCPIVTCEYHQKGFARKYDKNRHTLTHYKGTMVCGFCPGSGSAAEKSFNRADVFKRHLTSVHGVEQTPPNSRKKPSVLDSDRKLTSYAADATGKCSTCSSTFTNAQHFYEHLDDCVLRIVQQEDPSEAINEKQLAALNNDAAVEATLKAHNLSSDPWTAEVDGSSDVSEDDQEDDETSLSDRKPRPSSSKVLKPTSTRITKSTANNKRNTKGMTHSKGGVALVVKGGRKKRKNFPLSWGCSADKMKMKKRVLCVYDGQRRLWKDDMMLDNEFEVRLHLGDGKGYVTDLDVETLKRADAFHGATVEEKGPWLESEDIDLGDLMK